MTTMTTAPMDVTDTYRDPRTLAQATLRFYRERGGRRRYVVATTLPGDEPSYQFFPSVEAAREGWKTSLGTLRRWGFAERSGREIRTRAGRRRAK